MTYWRAKRAMTDLDNVQIKPGQMLGRAERKGRGKGGVYFWSFVWRDRVTAVFFGFPGDVERASEADEAAE